MTKQDLLVEYGMNCGRAGLSLGQAIALRWAAIKLHRLYVENYNGTVEEGAYETSRRLALAMVVIEKGVEVEEQTDPRGWPLFVRTGPTHYEGFRVPPF